MGAGDTGAHWWCRVWSSDGATTWAWESHGGSLGDSVGVVVPCKSLSLWAVCRVCGHYVGGVVRSLSWVWSLGLVDGSSWCGWGLRLAAGGALGALLVVWVGDTKLGGVLVLAGGVVDQLDTVALSVLGWLKVVLGRPDE